MKGVTSDLDAIVEKLGSSYEEELQKQLIMFISASIKGGQTKMLYDHIAPFVENTLIPDLKRKIQAKIINSN